MKLSCLYLASLLLPLASAFTIPASPLKSTTALQATDFSDSLGAQPPLGYWDPLNFLEGADQDRFDRLRYVELKHGRIAMLATLGHLTVACGYTLSGSISSQGQAFASIPNGFKGLSSMPLGGLLQMLAFVGFLELFVMKDVTGDAEFPGDFRNGFLDFGWDKFTEEEKMQKVREGRGVKCVGFRSPSR